MKAVYFPVAITAGVVALLALSASKTIPASPAPPPPPVPNPNPAPVPGSMAFKEGDTVQVPLSKLPKDALPAYVLDPKNFPSATLPSVTGFILNISSASPESVQGYIVGAYFQDAARRIDSPLPALQKVGPVIVPLSVVEGVA